MIHSDKKNVQILGKILQSKCIFNIIISPGSRNAPIIIHFTRKKYFQTYSIIDERCACYFALGMAQQINKPVVVNCTSGTAVVNYYPAIIEAFYQKIPIIVITADRPKEIVNIFDGQSINQKNIFNNYVEKFVQLTENESNKGLWYNSRLINECINECILKSKPVHINIPFSEPLYGITNKIQVEPNIIKTFRNKKVIINQNEFRKEMKIWKNCKKKMILLGLNNYFFNKKINKILTKISLDPSIIIFSETTSHIYGNLIFSSIDRFLFKIKIKKWIELKPQILLTFGINIISKTIKYFLRKFPPKYHWHISDQYNNHYPDTYYQLSTYFPIHPEIFFKYIMKNNDLISSNYQKNWMNFIKVKYKNQKNFLMKEKSFSDLKVLFFIFSKIPKYSILQLGNSMIIRYYQLFHNKRKRFIKSYCNRGVSGIDGSVSTAIGSSIKTKKIVTLIIGDISFFYDSNALWNNYTPKNFKIILINNGKGEIFNTIFNKKLDNKTINFFETKHDLSAKNLCKMYKWKYEEISSFFDLKKIISFFWIKNNGPYLLEINTKRCNNSKIFKKFLNYSS